MPTASTPEHLYTLGYLMGAFVVLSGIVQVVLTRLLNGKPAQEAAATNGVAVDPERAAARALEQARILELLNSIANQVSVSIRTSEAAIKSSEMANEAVVEAVARLTDSIERMSRDSREWEKDTAKTLLELTRATDTLTSRFEAHPALRGQALATSATAR